MSVGRRLSQWLSKRRDDRGADEPRDDEPLRLEVPPPESQPRADIDEPGARTPVNWMRAAKIAGLVVAVAAVTTFVVDQRHDATTEAADNETVNLALTWDVSSGLERADNELRISALVFNAGPKNLDLISAYPEGWKAVAISDHRRTLEVGKWTEVPLRLIPNCDVEDPDTVIANVVTGSGTREVRINIPPSSNSEVSWGVTTFCGSGEELWISVFEATLSPPTDGVLPMDLHVGTQTMAPEQRLNIVGITTDVPGIVAERDGFPHEITLSGLPGPSDPISVRWRVAECARAANFGEVNIDIHWEAPDSGQSGESMDQVPMRGAIALARFVEQECS